MELDARHRFEEMHHKGGGDHRRDEVDKGQAEYCSDAAPPEKYSKTKTVARRLGRRGIEPSERDRLEILPTEKISVKSKEEKQIYPGDQEIYRKRQEVEHECQSRQAQHGRDGFADGLSTRG